MERLPHQIPIDHHPGVWRNLSEWTSHGFQYAVNVSRFAPSFEDLVWAGPRMVKKLGSFITFQDAVENIGQRFVPDPTGSGIFHHSGAVAAAAGDMTSGLNMDARSTARQAVGAGQEATSTTYNFPLEGAKGLGSVFSYATSKWALCCIAMAIILNRTYIFAATRRRLRLTWPIRILLRFSPIILFLIQGRRLLQAMQCQTSPRFAEMRWGDSTKTSELMFTQDGGFLHTLSSTILWGSSDDESCLAVGMISKGGYVDFNTELHGSLSLLWPLFGTFCWSQFLETISCAVQGRPLAAETGMTLFEYSLAFAEAEAAISNQVGSTLFTQDPIGSSDGGNTGHSIFITRSMVLQRVNTPPEVLLVTLISVMSHLTSHILGIFNRQAKFRLLATGFWGLCFMGSIVTSAFSFSVDDPSTHGILRYPTVCIIGFVPHVVVLSGIIMCGIIYGIALFLSALAVGETPPGQRNLTFRERLAHARSNMQANISLSDIRVGREMDFYTALLRTGFTAITLASEAVYLNEDRDVSLKAFTWLEDERFRELEELRMQYIGNSSMDSHGGPSGTVGLIPIRDGPVSSSSGYGRERAAQKLSKTRSGERRLRDGVGAAERSGRWLMALDYLMSINRLVFRAWATGLVKLLTKIGIRPPGWLLWLTRRSKQQAGGDRSAHNVNEARAHMLAGAEQGVEIPETDTIDVEVEFRRRTWANAQGFPLPDEEELDHRLYRWWLHGGWWGLKDTSGDYQPSSYDDDDVTSVISAVTETETDDDEDDWESEAEGQRTPTQTSPFATRESTPMHDNPMCMADLARLLNPANPEEREEARTLSAHLTSHRIMTRSHYNSLQRRRRAEILDPVKFAPNAVGRSAKLTLDEEAELLEQILLQRRKQGRDRGETTAGSGTWADGASGMGENGPQCVVCQSASRTIIVWPCRCLSLCDDCRVSLAMNNFDKCVCCRRDVVSFSRIFVP